MSEPNFFVIGVQKAGTTSFHRYLSLHPDIFLPKQKETKFFICDDYYNRGVSFYQEMYFHDCGGKTAIGEIDPDYIFFPVAIKRLNGSLNLKSVRFVVLLRDPVHRAFSHYLMTYRRGLEPLSFAEAIREEAARLDGSYHVEMHFSYVSRGFYMRQIERFLEYVNLENFCFLLTEDLERKPHETLSKVFRFLGVDPEFEAVNVGERYHVATVPQHVGLTRVVRQPSSLKRFCKRLIPLPAAWRWSGSRMLELNSKDAQMIQPNEESIRFLSSHYHKENGRLAEFLGRDLSHWL